MLLNCDIKYAYCLKDNWILTLVALCAALIWCMRIVIFCIFSICICTFSLLYNEYEINLLLLIVRLSFLTLSIAQIPKLIGYWDPPGRRRVSLIHDDVIKWKHFPRYWPFVRGIYRSPVNSPHKGQWRGALMFSLICARINGRVNNGEAGDLRRHRAQCDVNVMGRGIPKWKNVFHDNAFKITDIF